jgi:hypothetical protein
MSRSLPYRPLAVLVVTSLAAFLALGGTGGAAGTAAPPNNSVGTPQIKNNAVVAAKIKSNAVVAAKIASNAVVAAKIASNAVSSAKIAANAVTSEKVQDGSITAGDLAAGVLPPSSAAGRFANGPVNVGAAQTTIASLAIADAGNYVLFAKAYATAAPLGSGVISCRLQAGANFDESQGFVEDGKPTTLSVMVLNNYNAAGTADFSCSGGPLKQVTFVKITALRFATVANTG